ncbi:MAG TPA: hypothetical protein VKF17_16730 [Isosphaeraceae bacterium]|nr:hypothetical protein [Isosphaeraceae bacterium]
MKLVQVSYTSLLIAVGQLLIALGHEDPAATIAAVKALVQAFETAALPAQPQ